MKKGGLVSFSALTLMTGWQEGHRAHKNTIALSVLEQEEEEEDPGKLAEPDSCGKMTTKQKYS